MNIRSQETSASPRWEVVNRDTDDVVASYFTRAEANAHVERFPNDVVRRALRSDDQRSQS